MRAFIFLCCLAAIRAAAEEDCKGGLQFDGKYYDQEILKKDLDKPYQLVVDKKANTLYFSYSVGVFETKSASINLDNNNFTDILDIKAGFAAAVDQKQGIVYLGGSDGIYVLDEKTKTARHTEATEKNIWALFFKDNLYFIDYPEQKLYVHKGNESVLVPEFAETSVTHFAINKDGERFFTNETGLYGLEKDGALDKAKLYDAGVAITGITFDKDGRVYFSGTDGLFTLDEEKKIKRIATIPIAFGLAFDKDNNVIYATSDKIIKLAPNTRNCTVFAN